MTSPAVQAIPSRRATSRTSGNAGYCEELNTVRPDLFWGVEIGPLTVGEDGH